MAGWGHNGSYLKIALGVFHEMQWTHQKGVIQQGILIVS